MKAKDLEIYVAKQYFNPNEITRSHVLMAIRMGLSLAVLDTTTKVLLGRFVKDADDPWGYRWLEATAGITLSPASLQAQCEEAMLVQARKDKAARQ